MPFALTTWHCPFAVEGYARSGTFSGVSPPIHRLAGTIDVNHRVELVDGPHVEVVALPFGRGLVDHSAGAPKSDKR